MGQITLRGMDPEVEKKIRRMARQTGRSLNRTILDIIYQYKGLMKRGNRSPANSLRKLAGGWNEQEASEFMESIKSCEQIEEDMWR